MEKEFEIKTFEEFKNERKDPTCFGKVCFECKKNPAEYRGGDTRFDYPACEECYGIKHYYDEYVARIESRKKARETWTKIINDEIIYGEPEGDKDGK